MVKIVSWNVSVAFIHFVMYKLVNVLAMMDTKESSVIKSVRQATTEKSAFSNALVMDMVSVTMSTVNVIVIRAGWVLNVTFAVRTLCTDPTACLTVRASFQTLTPVIR